MTEPKKEIKPLKFKLIKLLEFIIKKLEELHFKISERKESEVNYSSLSPIGDADEKGYYSKAFL